MSVPLGMVTLDSNIGAIQPVRHALFTIYGELFADESGPIVHGVNGFGQVFVLASAYYVGTEIISLAAGETKEPRKSIPKVRPHLEKEII